MVITLVVPVRRALRLEHLITDHHLDQLAKMLLLTGCCVIYSYIVEFFSAWYSGDAADRFVHFMAWPRGPYWPVFALMMLGNVIAPQLLWSGRVRRSPLVLLAVAVVVNVGMWCERFMIVVGSLSRDFLPSSWGQFAPTVTDLAIFGGTLGFFLFLFLSFLRFVPVVAVSELKEEALHAPR